MKSYVVATAWCKRCMQDGVKRPTRLGEVTRTFHEVTGWRTVWRAFERSWIRRQKQSDDPLPMTRYGITVGEDRNPNFVPKARTVRVQCKIHGSGSVCLFTMCLT